MATNAILPNSQTTLGNLRLGPSKAANAAIFMDPEEIRHTEYTVYLHTVNKRVLQQDHAIYRNIIIPACPKDKRYITFMRVNHPVMMGTVNPDNPSQTMLRVENARRVALSICDPNYNGVDFACQDSQVHSDIRMSGSESNLTRQGVWASDYEFPPEEEIKKAENRVVEYYRFIFNDANAIARSNPRKLQDILSVDHHMAAEMFQVDVAWHNNVSPKVDCPNCGDKIKEGLSYHMNNGRPCILNWEGAYLAGIIKKDDVPEPYQWWHEGAEINRVRKAKQV